MFYSMHIFHSTTKFLKLNKIKCNAIIQNILPSFAYNYLLEYYANLEHLFLEIVAIFVFTILRHSNSTRLHIL